MRSTGTIFIKIVNLTEYRGLLGFAEALPAAQTFGFSPSDLKLETPVEKSAFQNSYLILALVAIAILIIFIILLRKRRK